MLIVHICIPYDMIKSYVLPYKIVIQHRSYRPNLAQQNKKVYIETAGCWLYTFYYLWYEKSYNTAL